MEESLRPPVEIISSQRIEKCFERTIDFGESLASSLENASTNPIGRPSTERARTVGAVKELARET